MNIILLNTRLTECVKAYCDEDLKHQSPICMQLLINAHHRVDGTIGEGWPESQELDNPASLWTANRGSHYFYVHRLFALCNEEHIRRFDKPDHYWGAMGEALQGLPDGLKYEPSNQKVTRICIGETEGGIPLAKHGTFSLPKAMEIWRHWYVQRVSGGVTYTRTIMPEWLLSELSGLI